MLIDIAVPTHVADAPNQALEALAARALPRTGRALASAVRDSGLARWVSAPVPAWDCVCGLAGVDAPAAGAAAAVKAMTRAAARPMRRWACIWTSMVGRGG